ncbi:MAG TPA: cupredoxin domain-containing protein [Blastocatellia bacterium]|nr:cupredoxin domain-containing protein [Blastocatellia bacterium]
MRKLAMTILMGAMSLAMVAGVAEARTAKASSKAKGATAASRAGAEKAVVKISSFKYEPKTLTVPVGTTVQWVNEGGRHTVEADDGSFKSDTLQTGGTFEHTFDKPGSYPYHCTFHGEAGGKDMAGKVVVTRAKK